ncbi:MAG: hypothetical protein C0499_02330 [Zymomonas sp.]|nr:hypothetical protein [Zymomonas sp.]
MCLRCGRELRADAFYLLPPGKPYGACRECLGFPNRRRPAGDQRALASARNRRYNRSHRSAISDKQRQRRRATPGLTVAECQRYRARKKRATGSISGAEVTALYAEYGHRCAYCGRQRSLTLDHVRPLSKGGEHTIRSAAPACVRCNSSKHDRDILQWLASGGFRAIA